MIFLSAVRGRYLATASCRAESWERGGVSIWQVRPWRVCERDSLSNDLRNWHPSLYKQK